MSERKKYAHGDLFGTFQGRIVGEPNIKTYNGNGGQPYELVNVRAVCAPYNGKRDPEDMWVTLRFNGGSAPLSKKLKKGDEVLVRGSIRPRTWETREGQTRLEIDINVSRDWNSLIVTKYSEKNGNGGGGQQASAPSSTPSEQPQPAAAAATSGGGDNMFDDEDVPF